MKHWPDEMPITIEGICCPHQLFERVQAAARDMGFEFCAFGLRMPFPLSRPNIKTFSNYPHAWRLRYAEMNYVAVDPSVAHGRRSMRPGLWDDSLFVDTPMMWSEARAAGLRHGRFQSHLETSGLGSMLTLARSNEEISVAELHSHALRLVWLNQVVHQAFANLLSPKCPLQPHDRLTQREVEVLQWTADGKTTGQISDILIISENTVNFHIKNAVFKLQASNKTAAAVRAAMLGMLS
jgi:DNA-binding CsgD family transcriptional regulator